MIADTSNTTPHRKEYFRLFAHRISQLVGTAKAFVLAVFLIILWITSGPIFNYSDRWQLAINTLTTITTFLMVFIIQNTQNRESKAINLKLDELIRAMRPARNKFVDSEDMSDEELQTLEEEFRRMREKRDLPRKKS